MPGLQGMERTLHLCLVEAISMPVTEKERRLILAAILRGGIGRLPEQPTREAPVRQPLTPEEMAMMRALAEGENAQARQRVQAGIADESDFFVSPFAPNVFGTGPVGPGGLGFGVAPSLVGDQAFELPAPSMPDRAVIPPELLQLLLSRVLQGI